MRGTADYIAPELLEDNVYHDYKVDVWALGVLLFEMVVGVPPFNDNTPQDIFERIKRRDIVDWETLKGILDAITVDLIDSLLQSDPNKRPTLEQLKRH